MISDGYRALRESAAWCDLSGRGHIRASGRDRARLLHAISTNHIKELAPGAGCYAFFLTAQGRITGDAYILCRPDSFLLDTEPETALKLLQHVNKHIIADDVSLEDRTAKTAVLAVEGPAAAEVLARAGAPAPEALYGAVEWNSCLVARVSSTGQPGYRIFVPTEEKDRLASALTAGGASPATAEDARTVRIENGKPRYGDDISDTNLPQETRQLHAVHFNKGCYLGQEIVERIRARGHVNRLLEPLDIDAAAAPPAAVKVLLDGKEVGEITSAVLSPRTGRVAALGYLRAEVIRPDVALVVGGAGARIAAQAAS